MMARRLDPVLEGYLDYLGEVRRQIPATIRDVRCTLKGVSQVMARLRPQVPLWRVRLEDYLRWLEEERGLGRRGSSLAKRVSVTRFFCVPSMFGNSGVQVPCST